MIDGITEEAYSTFKYNGVLMIVDYFQESDTWQCMDAKFTIKGRGRTMMGAICEAKTMWDEYLKKQVVK
jgi:hypothetical protein